MSHRCERELKHAGPHQGGGYEWHDDPVKIDRDNWREQANAWRKRGEEAEAENALLSARCREAEQRADRLDKKAQSYCEAMTKADAAYWELRSRVELAESKLAEALERATKADENAEDWREVAHEAETQASERALRLTDAESRLRTLHAQVEALPYWNTDQSARRADPSINRAAVLALLRGDG